MQKKTDERGPHYVLDAEQFERLAAVLGMATNELADRLTRDELPDPCARLREHLRLVVTGAAANNVEIERLRLQYEGAKASERLAVAELHRSAEQTSVVRRSAERLLDAAQHLVDEAQRAEKMHDKT